jgi:large subunit ribosomal protein L24
MKIKKGDEVLVIAGKDRGLKGKVISANPETNKVIVEGINRVKKHTALTTTSRGAKAGGIEHIEAAINASNVMVIDSDGKPTRVGYRAATEDDKKSEKNIRVSVRSGRKKDLS